MCRAGTAAAPAPPRQALPAVASTPARRPAARRGPQLSGLPDRARSGAGVPAGRLRRADADGVDGPCRAAPGAAAGGRDPDPLTVRGVAAVRLRRGVHVRRRQSAGRAARRRAGAGPDVARRAAGPCRAARAARRRRRRQHVTPASTSGRGPAGPRRRGCRRPAASARPADRRRGRRAQHRRRRGRLAGRPVGGQAGGDGLLCRAELVGRGRGHRPAAGRCRGRGAGRGADRVPRTGRRPAG